MGVGGGGGGGGATSCLQKLHPFAKHSKLYHRYPFRFCLLTWMGIALDKELFFQPKSVYVFLISRRKYIMWVLIRRASGRGF